MNKNFTQVINITNKYIVLATPLILFTLISNVYFFVVASGKMIHLLFGLFLLFLMAGAFVSGWFRMVKDAIAQENDENPNAILKNFVSGVGEYFLPALGGMVLSFIFFLIISAILYFVGIKFIGNPSVDLQELQKAMANTAQLKSFLDTLSPEQIIKFGYWNVLIFAFINLYYFLIMFFFPAIFYKTKNPLVAFFISLKDLFSKKFLKSLILFIVIIAIYFLISLFSVILGANAIFYFILTLVNFYFITAVVVGVFNFYHQNFVQSQIGQNVDLTI